MASKEMKCPFAKVSVEEACGWEVSLFLHCHLRGYDEQGEGKFQDMEYFDKYGSPVHSENSWEEGYHQIEKRLADYYDKMVKLDFPFIAGLAGAAHLYKGLHNNKPWNWTGWIPLQKRLYSQNKFFKNRYFLGIRGNEIQNNLWDYHPYEEEEENFCELDYSQVEPNDRYRGGYWFYRQAFGRYLHIIALKSHDADPKTRRYNYIVHPLAYRAAIDTIPDNSVDAMQWCIINMPEEEHFGKDQPWGEKCHGLEIFNDYTYFHSYQQIEKNGPYNGELSPKEYYFWFNTYPLEFAEFMLDSGLARGSYFHTIAANDAFYDRNEEHFASTDPKGRVHSYHPKEKTGIEEYFAVEEDIESIDGKGHLHIHHREQIEEHLASTDPKEKTGIDIYVAEEDYESTDGKGNLHIYHKEQIEEHLASTDPKEKTGIEIVVEEDIESTDGKGYHAYHREQIAITDIKEKKGRERNNPLVNRLPYKEKTVFGFVTLFDTQEHGIKDVVCKQRDGLSCMGMDKAGNIALDYLVEGRYYSSTGIHDLFECDLNHPLPYRIYDQPDSQQMCYDIGQLEMVFTFLRIKKENADLVWRYTIMLDTPLCSKTQEQGLKTIHGYFKLSTEGQTNLDLRCYEKSRVKWLYFTAIRPRNPQHRAWFHAIRGPAFGKPYLHARLPALDHYVVKTERIKHCVSPKKTGIETTGRETTGIKTTGINLTVVELPKGGSLDFLLRKPRNECDIYVYSMQVCPHQQNLTQKPVNKKIRESSDLIPPRILQSVHGYFNLRDDHPTRLNLCASWDSKTLKDQKVSFYIVDSKTGDPRPIPDSDKPSLFGNHNE